MLSSKKKWDSRNVKNKNPQYQNLGAVLLAKFFGAQISLTISASTNMT